MGSRVKPKTGAAAPERASRQRQRQRLIDACIAALHLHGPSRTTVEKVVALAQMSPGIVRFYFDSKDAMLIASLAYLATEFEERVMVPVAGLRAEPVAALKRLVELYFDPDIASPRKVSVWYSFWGEASSRQEYHDICGKKDEEFAELVHELIGRMIRESGAAHLDADAIALGLIGVLEVLWQTIAFQNETDIDRVAARERALAYLRSVFPGYFGPAQAATPASPMRLPARAYTDPALQTLERERILKPAWQIVGHQAELAAGGDFLTADLGFARVLVVRDDAGRLRAFRNACPQRPHALASEHSGHLANGSRCATHGLHYGLDGRAADAATAGVLAPLALAEMGPLILVRAATGPGSLPEALEHWALPATLRPAGLVEREVLADWKVVVEQWLEGQEVRFLPPNQLLEISPEGAAILQVLPQGTGRCRIRRFDFAPLGRPQDLTRLRLRLDANLAQQIDLAASTQAGFAAGSDAGSEAPPAGAALGAFRASIAALLP